MNKNLNISFLIFIVLGLFNNISNAQKTIKTESGQEILILKDGSWKYKTNETVRTTSLPTSQDIDSNSTSVAEENKVNTEKHHKSQNEELNRLRFKAFEIEANTAVEYALIIDKIKAQEEKVKNGGKSNVNRESQKELKEELRQLKTEEKKLAQDVGKTDKLVKDIIHIYNLKEASTGIKIVMVREKLASYQRGKRNSYNPNYDIQPSYVLKVNNDDVMLFPPQEDCNVKFEGIDEYTGKERKEMAPHPVFSYTHPKLKANFRQKDFLECKGYLTSMSGYVYLTLEFKLLSETAPKTYGLIPQGNIITLNLINGEKLVNSNMSNSEGMVDKTNRCTYYKAVYALGRGQVKTLKKFEIDKIGIMWSTGYEEYEVYEVDFFMNQLKCLQK